MYGLQIVKLVPTLAVYRQMGTACLVHKLIAAFGLCRSSSLAPVKLPQTVPICNADWIAALLNEHVECVGSLEDDCKGRAKPMLNIPWKSDRTTCCAADDVSISCL